jgi:hypothetical protein
MMNSYVAHWKGRHGLFCFMNLLLNSQINFGVEVSSSNGFIIIVVLLGGCFVNIHERSFPVFLAETRNCNIKRSL